MSPAFSSFFLMSFAFSSFFQMFPDFFPSFSISSTISRFFHHFLDASYFSLDVFDFFFSIFSIFPRIFLSILIFPLWRAAFFTRSWTTRSCQSNHSNSWNARTHDTQFHAAESRWWVKRATGNFIPFVCVCSIRNIRRILVELHQKCQGSHFINQKNPNKNKKNFRLGPPFFWPWEWEWYISFTTFRLVKTNLSHVRKEQTIKQQRKTPQ